MEEDRQPSFAQFRHQPAQPLGRAGIDLAVCGDPFITAEPAGIRIALGDVKENLRRIVGLDLAKLRSLRRRRRLRWLGYGTEAQRGAQRQSGAKHHYGTPYNSHLGKVRELARSLRLARQAAEMEAVGVRFREQTGTYVLTLWSSHFDPKETFAGGETKVRAVNVHAPK